MSKPKGLGRGLDALIPQYTDYENDDNNKAPDNASLNSAAQFIKVESIKPNDEQPRKVFDPEKISELAASIKQQGVLTPLLVVKDKEYYKLVAGERRLRAAIYAGLKEVPAVIKEFSPSELLLASLVENIQREDLNDIETAYAYKRLADEFSMSQDNIASSVGKSRAAVANSMRLLALPKEVCDMVSNAQITSGHARAVLALENENDRVAFAKYIQQNSLSVRESEKLSKTFSTKKETIVKKTPDKAPYLVKFEDELSMNLGTKVTILNKKKGGQVLLDYYSNEDLERLIELLLKEEHLS